MIFGFIGGHVITVVCGDPEIGVKAMQRYDMISSFIFLVGGIHGFLCHDEKDRLDMEDLL